ncbi:cysteine/serine-rich nuclear protein 2-like [Varroa destructor]|uniref:Cysteine/serine-rich nuclear protein N-terminal domain-containing protein n=1 Tax=Varroa destructor TaxID=109461 RepID=A0A7M7KMQ3_VARDE|nr:cysteine/serine-rich nuclear protein 2-like [Varroa destructor]
MSDVETKGCTEVHAHNDTDQTQQQCDNQAAAAERNTPSNNSTVPVVQSTCYDVSPNDSQRSGQAADTLADRASFSSDECASTSSDSKSAQKRKGTDSLAHSSASQAVLGYGLPKERKLKDLGSSASAMSTSRSAIDQLSGLSNSSPNTCGVAESGRKKLVSCLKKKSSDANKIQANKKEVQFDKTTVYYFERAQGFTSVPIQGGSTLGMSYTHLDVEERSFQDADDCPTKPFSGDGAESIAANSVPYPIPSQQRRELLRNSGVEHIDPNEYVECEKIRASRERCGCKCPVRCDPSSCLCIMENIPCQADTSGIACICSRDECQNPNGRSDFDAIAVRFHVARTCVRANRELDLHSEHSRDPPQGWANLSFCGENNKP